MKTDEEDRKGRPVTPLDEMRIPAECWDDLRQLRQMVEWKPAEAGAARPSLVERWRLHLDTLPRGLIKEMIAELRASLNGVAFAPERALSPDKGAPSQQIQFQAIIGDVPMRDDREGMSVPLVSLAKGKRVEPIEWKSSDGARFTRVSPSAEHGLATIWDMDVLIWAVSQVNAGIEAGLPVSPVLRFQPYDMLKAIGRGTSGDNYKELEGALNRLAGSMVETNIRIVNRSRKSVFHLLEGWSHDTDKKTGRSLGMQMTLPHWIYDGVVNDRDVLAISPAYFDLSSGIARWLYRLARRHAGKQEAGWRFTMKELHARSGSVQPLKELARAIRKEVAKGGVLEYRMDIVQGQHGDEVVLMVRDPSKVSLPQKRTLARVKLPPSATICSGDGHVGSPAAGHVGSPAKTRRITRRNRTQRVDPKG